MAGRVERRINDKFYFVVDEVGGSSGIESETDSVDVISAKRPNGGDKIEGQNEYKTKISNVSRAKLENNMCSSRINDPGGETNNSDDNCEENDMVNTVTVENDNAEIKPNSKSSDVEPLAWDSENLEAVNMDIDNDSDESEEGFKRDMIPIIKISFRDEKVEKTYKSSLLKFLAQKIHSSTVSVNSENSLELEIYEHTENKSENDVLDFDLDTTPGYDSHSNRVPSYGKNHEILLSDSDSVQQTTCKNEALSPVCFNCSGKHLLRDCPEERDMKKIIQNRSKFQTKSKPTKTSRYHLDENQRFGNVVPGELSKKLRGALSLKKDQQPLFIYRMRLLGYPPAWLEEARVSHSGVAIYDKNGQPITEDGEEEGEIIPDNAKDRFDISKIIEFPGFNVPLPKNMKEEGKLHSCPAMSEEQSKENLIKKLAPNAVQAYKKRSHTLIKYSSEDVTSAKKDRKVLSSPTIEEMEEKKRLLLLALDDEDADNECKLNQVSTGDGGDSETQPETPESSTSVKNMDFGTPILKSISLYSKLPPREQFSVNVSEVINFENLPNSTGKYESMTNLIHKIRDTVSRIQNE